MPAEELHPASYERIVYRDARGPSVAILQDPMEITMDGQSVLLGNEVTMEERLLTCARVIETARIIQRQAMAWNPKHGRLEASDG